MTCQWNTPLTAWKMIVNPQHVIRNISYDNVENFISNFSFTVLVCILTAVLCFSFWSILLPTFCPILPFNNGPTSRINYHHKTRASVITIPYPLKLKSVKCYRGGRQIHFILSISKIQTQMVYHCVQYTRHHLMSLISHF